MERPTGRVSMAVVKRAARWAGCCRWLELEAAVVAEQSPQHVDAAAGEGDQRLLVLASFGAFALVVVPVRAVHSQRLSEDM